LKEKNSPKNSTKDYKDRGGKTVGLLLRLTKPFWYSRICLVLDSGFSVLKALVELRMVGIYAAAVIKKRHYWLKYIFGREIADHFIGRQVGLFDVQHG
jgi:Transposase IS4